MDEGFASLERKLEDRMIPVEAAARYFGGKIAAYEAKVTKKPKRRRQ